ncbi:MAG: hypothetical protein M3Z27_06955 [Actinomycetota bacterium]|nr:hypothetical protein [Actinomycetota bacterium]
MIGRLITVTAAVLTLAAPAQAQSGSGLFLSTNLISATAVDSTLTGSLAVSFHGDPAAGCALKGVCAYSGVIISRPGGGGELTIATSREGGRVVRQVSLNISGSSGDPTSAGVSAGVTRAAPGQPAASCADTSATEAQTRLPLAGRQVSVRALSSGSSVLATRCAGPLDADLAPFLPTVSLPLAVLARGHRRIDLSGTRGFLAGGFSGTLTSTLALRLGAAQSTRTGRGGGRRGRAPRLRLVTAPLRVEGASGGFDAGFTGSATPDVCAPLDSCGLRGTLSLRPRPMAATGELLAFGPARRPLRDFLAALGLSRRGRASGIIAFGGVVWDGGGTLTSVVSQAGACRDSVALGGAALDLGLPGRTVRYLDPSDPFRSRCPGPLLSSPNALAFGRLPAGGLARGRLTVVVGAHRTFRDDGYDGLLSGRLSLTLQRGRIQQRFLRQLVGG